MTRRSVILAAAAAALLAASCDRGDYLGPMERTLRTILGGWDMWSTDAVRPYERPMPAVPDGSVPMTGRKGYDDALRELKTHDEETMMQKAALVYGRFCHHCHGASGDGRTIVGESFSPALPDLGSPGLQTRSDKDIFEQIAAGSARMIPLADTLTPLDILLAIRHVRTLAGAPSVPYFTPKYTEPIK
jgi:hypothetical protein